MSGSSVLDPPEADRVDRSGTGRLGGLSASAFRWGLAAAALLGFAIRLVTLFTVARRDPDGRGDPRYYHDQANMVVHGLGFGEPFRWFDSHFHTLVPSASHPPLYTLWLAIPSLFGAQSWLAHKLVSCLAGTLAVAVIGLVAREVAGRRAGLIAALLAACYPNLWMIDGILMPEGLFSLMIGLTLLSAYRWWRTPSTGWALALGATIALAALTRGEAVMLLGVLVVPLVIRRQRLAPDARVRHVAVMGVAAVGLLAPWMVRNATAFHNIVPLSNNSNEVIYYANCHDSYYGQLMGFWSYPCQVRDRLAHGEPPGDESDKALYWRTRGIDYASDHKSRVPIVVAVRIGRIWDAYAPFQNAFFTQIEGRTLWVSQAGLFYYWSLLIPAAVGLVDLWRRRVTVIPLLAMGVLVTLTAVYAYGATRFRTPADVAILVLAGVGVDFCWRRWRHQPAPQAHHQPAP